MTVCTAILHDAVVQGIPYKIPPKPFPLSWGVKKHLFTIFIFRDIKNYYEWQSTERISNNQNG